MVIGVVLIMLAGLVLLVSAVLFILHSLRSSALEDGAEEPEVAAENQPAPEATESFWSKLNRLEFLGWTPDLGQLAYGALLGLTLLTSGVGALMLLNYEPRVPFSESALYSWTLLFAGVTFLLASAVFLVKFLAGDVSLDDLGLAAMVVGALLPAAWSFTGLQDPRTGVYTPPGASPTGVLITVALFTFLPPAYMLLARVPPTDHTTDEKKAAAPPASRPAPGGSSQDVAKRAAALLLMRALLEHLQETEQASSAGTGTCAVCGCSTHTASLNRGPTAIEELAALAMSKSYTCGSCHVAVCGNCSTGATARAGATRLICPRCGSGVSPT